MADIIRPEFPQTPEDPGELVANINSLYRKLDAMPRSLVTWRPPGEKGDAEIAATTPEIMAALSLIIAWIEDFRTENPDRRFTRNNMSDHDWNMLFLAQLAADRFERRRAEDKGYKQIALAGDFMFDNAAHVMGGAPVIEQMRQSLPPSWSAHRIAFEGELVRYVSNQIRMLPDHTTDLVLSVGALDVVACLDRLAEDRREGNIAELIAEPLADFRLAYSRLLDLLGQLKLNVCVCTICTAFPFANPTSGSLAPFALAAFNDVIVDEAKRRGMAVIRLEDVCNAEDFSIGSPVNLLEVGGQKIAKAVLAAMSTLRC